MRNDRAVIFYSREYGNDIPSVFDNQVVVCETFGWMITEELQTVKDRSIIGPCYEIFPVFVVPFSESMYFHIEYQYSKRTHIVNDSEFMRQDILRGNAET